MAKTNLEILRDRFTRAGYTKKGRNAIMGGIAGGKDVELQKKINKMDRLTFEDFFKGVVIPSSAIFTEKMIQKFPDEDQKLSAKQTALAKMGDEWDGDRFRAVIGRKPRKVMLEGKEVTRPARIGELNEQDVLKLIHEGISKEEIAKYADQFREEEEQEFLKSQKELLENTRKELEEKQRKEREFMAKNATDYLYEFEPDDSKFERWGKILKNTALGTGIDVLMPEVRAEFEEAIREGRDPKWMNAILKDFGFNTLLSLTPFGVSKAVERTGLKGLKNVGANFLGNFVALFAENTARQAMSDHYRIDPKSSVAASSIGATVPSLVSGALLGANKYIPSLRRYTIPALRRSRGLTETPEMREVGYFELEADDLHNYMGKIATGELWQQNNAYKIAQKKSQELADRVNTIKGIEDPELMYTQGQIMQMAMTKRGLGELKDILQAPTGEQLGAMTDAEAVIAERAFPEIVKELREKDFSNVSSDRIADAVNYVARTAEGYGGVFEPIREIYPHWGRDPSVHLDSLMKANPRMIQDWEDGWSDISPEIQALYDEWQNKYGSKL